MRQVYENKESTIQQYALKEKLMNLGWNDESIIIIDSDLGQSGGKFSERDGFKQLVADVGSSEVGAIASIECSRLSRSSNDWGRLMEICAITNTVLIDADGIYDPNNFNDRLLLGLKGTMSEAELHFIHARMRGGALNKAKRGEYKLQLPIGYIYDELDLVIKDPNLEIQNAINLFFEAFRICGSAHRMISYYTKNGYKIPKDLSNGFNRREIKWTKPSLTRIINMLHNPSYAGIYAYGRYQTINTLNGKKMRIKPIDEWHVYIKEHHEGYISCDEYYKNQEKLIANHIKLTPVSPPREGNGLLQGMIMCGKCGMRMTTKYKRWKEKDIPYYVCDYISKQYTGEGLCQSVHGSLLDETISKLIIERLTPMMIENVIQVQKEIDQRQADSDNYFILKVECARYDVELAKKRYMSVDPSNRLVAFELERLWNIKIAELSKVEEEMKIHENSKENVIKDLDIKRLIELPDSVKNIWENKNINIQDKKRVLRLFVENVTIIKGPKTTQLGVYFKGGTSTIIECINQPMSFTKWQTPQEVIELVREKSMFHTAYEISKILNGLGYKGGKGGEINKDTVVYIQHAYKIPSLKKYLQSKGYLTVKAKAYQLGISPNQLLINRRSGEFKGIVFKTNEKGNYMFAPN